VKEWGGSEDRGWLVVELKKLPRPWNTESVGVGRRRPSSSVICVHKTPWRFKPKPLEYHWSVVNLFSFSYKKITRRVYTLRTVLYSWSANVDVYFIVAMDRKLCASSIGSFFRYTYLNNCKKTCHLLWKLSITGIENSGSLTKWFCSIKDNRMYIFRE